MGDKSVQLEYAPNSICFGCGPANADGLRIESYRIDNGLVMEYLPNDSHQAFPGMINGGIIGTLLDCHGNWTPTMERCVIPDMRAYPCLSLKDYVQTES